MLLDTREHVAEFNNPGPALAISDDDLRQRLRTLNAEAREIVRAGLAPSMRIDIEIQNGRAAADYVPAFDIGGRRVADRDGI